MSHLNLQDTAVIIGLLLVTGAAALVLLTWASERNPLNDLFFEFDKNVDLKNLPPKTSRIAPLLIVAIIIALLGITSWASQRDELARREDRAARIAAAAVGDAANQSMKVTINRHKVVEVETARCFAVANVANGTTYQSCVD